MASMITKHPDSAQAALSIDVHAVSAWAIERGLRLDALSVSRPTLEDVFLGLANGEELE